MSIGRIDHAYEVPPGWDPDPGGEHQYRYWDGERWTDRVSDFGVEALDPLPEASADTSEATVQLVYRATGVTVASSEVLEATDAVEALVTRLRELSRTDRRFRKREDVHQLAVEACRKIRDLRRAVDIGVLVIPAPEIVVEVGPPITWEPDAAQAAGVGVAAWDAGHAPMSVVEPWGPLVRRRIEIDLACAERAEAEQTAEPEPPASPESGSETAGAVIVDLFPGRRDDELADESTERDEAPAVLGAEPDEQHGERHKKKQGTKKKGEKGKNKKKGEKGKKRGKKKKGAEQQEKEKVVIDLTALEAEEAEAARVEVPQ